MKSTAQKTRRAYKAPVLKKYGPVAGLTREPGAS